jgi:hypothetical protein
MKIRFTVTLDQSTVDAFTLAGHVTATGIVNHLTSSLRSAIELIKHPQQATTADGDDLPAAGHAFCEICDKQYEIEKSKADDPDTFCSRKCEREAEDE